MSPTHVNAVASTSRADPYADYPSTAQSDWSTASNALKRTRTDGTTSTRRGPLPPGQLITTSDQPKTYSRLKQQVLSEEDYLTGLEDVILRDFFPQLATLTAQEDMRRAVDSGDDKQVQSSLRRMHELCTPTPKRQVKAPTPGRTPFDNSPSATPAYFGTTPSSTFTSSSRAPPAAAPVPPYDPSLSLDAFQARYTSEDNSSFSDLLAKDNQARREKNAWVYKAEERANQKAIRGREARERLVDVTRAMVEASQDGTVAMIEGPAGRPGERRLVVEGVSLGDESGRLMVEGKRAEGGRLMITGGEGVGAGGKAVASVPAGVVDKGKGKEKKSQYVDWDKPTVEEEEENKEIPPADLQVPVDAWQFTARNSLYFPPDADIEMQADMPKPALDPATKNLPAGEPKAIRYSATRLDDTVRPLKDAPSPSRSRIHAAISGTPYPGAPGSATPKVSGFSFVDALPTPRAASIDPKSLQELMTWGTITGTPQRGSTAEAAARRSALGDGGGPFRVMATPKRDELGHKLANKARKSMSNKAAGSTNALRRSVLDASVLSRGTARTPGGVAGGAGGGASPRAGAGLSPAAQALLGQTRDGKAMSGGLGRSEGWGKDLEDRARKERVARKERELQSRERLKRARWDASPGIEHGEGSGRGGTGA